MRRTIYHHNGYRLRSYTELLWARAMEAAGLFYLYEPDLIRVDDGFYLPDFWLPNVGIYLEVKGKNPTDEEINKADAVMSRTGREVFFLIGKPQADSEGLCNCGLLVKGAGGWTEAISPFDLHSIVNSHVGADVWLQIKLAVQEDELDWVRPIGDMLEEFFLVRADRSDMERILRETHAETNRARLEVKRDVTACERGLKLFLDRQQFRLDQKNIKEAAHV